MPKGRVCETIYLSVQVHYALKPTTLSQTAYYRAVTGQVELDDRFSLYARRGFDCGFPEFPAYLGEFFGLCPNFVLDFPLQTRALRHASISFLADLL
jgi:hypothetical protein